MSQNVTERIIPYIPRRFIELLDQGDRGGLRRIERSRGGVLFFDISGFTKIVGGYARDGLRGTETIMSQLTQLYTHVLSATQSSGGVAYQFAGDSVLIGFDAREGESEVDTVRRAVGCAWRVNESMERFSREANITEFRIKQGLAFGEYNLVLLGAGQSYYSPALVGPPVQEAIAAEHEAAGGQVILGPSTFSFLAGEVETEALAGGFRRLTAASLPVVEVPVPAITNLASESLLNKAKRFVAPNLLERVLTAEAGFLGEFRNVTVAMISFDGLAYRDQIRQDVQSLNRFYEYVQQLARRFSGTMIHTDLTDKGNVFIVLFGAPSAVKDKESLASRFALKLMSARTDFDFLASLRMGIATGMAYCGDLGATFRKGYTVVGEVVNLAARLMQYGADGQITVDNATEEKNRKNYTFQKHEDVELKGFAEKQNFFTLVSEIERFRGLLLKYGADDMVGRENEYRTLQEAMKKSFEGEGQICAVLGEAGIGKSKLAGKLLNELKAEDAEPLIGYCYSYEKFTPYFPWRELLLLYFQIFEAEDASVKAEKLTAGFKELDDVSSQWAPVLGQILGIPMEEEALTKNLDPRQKSERITEIIFQLLVLRSLQTPLVLYFEDCHWADDTSLRLIQYMATRIERLPIMLLLVSRPDIDLSAVSHLPNFTSIDLGEFQPEEARSFLRYLLKMQSPNQALEEVILGRSPGNPFFLESIVQGLQEKGRLVPDTNGHQKLIGNPADIQIPGSLQEVVLSRIDSLAEHNKTILKTASVIGRIFEVDTLRHLTPSSQGDRLPEALTILKQLDLTPLETEYPASYIFKHIVIRDVAYNTLLVSTREELHSKLARLFEQDNDNGSVRTPDVLAYHFSQGGEYERALHYTLIAARTARSRYANADATYYYEQAVKILSRSEFQDRQNELMDVREELAGVLMADGRFDEALSIYRDCMAHQQDPMRLADLHAGIGRIHQEMGDHENAVTELETGLRLAGGRPPGSKGRLILSILKEFSKHLLRVTFRRSPPKLSEAERSRLEKQTVFIRLLGKVYFWVDAEHVLWDILIMLNLSHRMNDDYYLGLAYGDWGVVESSLALFDLANKNLDRSHELAEKTGDPMLLALASNRRSTHCMYLNDPDGMVENVDQALNIYRQIGEVWERLVSLGIRAQGFFYAGKFEQSHRTWEEVLDLANRYDTDFHRAWALSWLPFYDYIMHQASPGEIRERLREAVLLTEQVNDQSTRSNALYNLICVALREEDADEAARLAAKTFEVISNYKVIIPQSQYAFVHAGEAALFALERDATGEISAGTLNRIVKNSLKRSLALGKKYGFLHGPSLRFKALYTASRKGDAPGAEAFAEAIRVFEAGVNAWETAVCYRQAARYDATNRTRYLDRARAIFEERQMQKEIQILNRMAT